MQRHLKPSIIAGTLGCALALSLASCSRLESAESLISASKQSAASGDNKRALIQLKNALEQQPDNAEARYLLGRAAIETGDAPSAEKELAKARELHYDASQLLPLQVRALMMQNKFEAALSLMKDEPDSAQVLSLRGNALLSLKRPEQARQAFDAALKLKPDDADALTGMARHAAMQRDLDGAQQFVDSALAKDGGNIAAWNFKGDLMQAQKRSEEALAAYQQVLKLKPDHRSAYLDTAFVRLHEGKLGAAQQAIDAARKTTPGNIAVTYAQGMMESHLGNYAKAHDLLLEVLKAAPQHMPSILQLGIVELNLEQLKPAEQHLKMALEAAPEDQHVRTLLAITQMRSQRPADALATLAPILGKQQTNTVVLSAAGEASISAGKPAQASVYFQRAIEGDPQRAALHTALGMSRFAEGKHQEAIEALRRGAEISKNTVAAVVPLIRVHMHLGQQEQALAAMAPLASVAENNAELLQLKGEIYRGMQDLPHARASFEKALQLNPQFYPAVVQMAQLEHDAGEGVQARARLTNLLKAQPKNANIYINLANIENLNKQRDVATKWLEKAVAAVPDASQATLALGAQYLTVQQPQKAVSLIRTKILAEPENGRLLDLLGRAQQAAGDPQGALESYSKLVAVEPLSALSHFRMAQVRGQMKNPAAALDSIKKAQELDPSYLPPYLLQLELDAARGDLDGALSVARRVQGLPGQAAAGYVLEGDLQIAKGKPAVAFSAYQKAYSSNPTPQLLIKQAKALHASGQSSKAEQLVAQWRQSHPQESSVAIYVAERQQAERQYDDAIASLEQIIKAEPRNPVALNNLAYLYQLKNDRRALPTAEAAYRETGDVPAVMDTLGFALVAHGDTTRGLSLLRKASTLAPDAAEIRYHMAWALHKSGDSSAARKELEQLLSNGKKFSSEADAQALLKQL